MSNITWRDETLTLSDGIQLISRIWSPNSEGVWPALLMRQPYGRNIASTVTYAHPEWWAKNGFLVVVQDVRGQGDSEGKFTGFEQESIDTSQTHKWVRGLPDCNGLLGTYGFSYQGLTQLISVPGSRPPDCMAPAMTGLDEKNHWNSDGDAYWWHLGIAWGLQLAALKAQREKNLEVWKTLRNSIEDGTYLNNGHNLLKKYDPDGMSYKWLLNSQSNEIANTIHKPLDSFLQAPMLLIGGWWDPHLKGILDIYTKSKNAGGNPELHIGAATHLEWWEGAQDIHMKFFKNHLQQETRNIIKQNYINLWNISTKKWEGICSKNYSSLKWGLHADSGSIFRECGGNLIKDKQGSGILSFVSDPWRPVPSLGGHLSPKAGLVDRKHLDKRYDVATFTSKKLTNSLRLQGNPEITLGVKADQEGFDLCVAFSIINKDGNRVNQISTGFLRKFTKEHNEKLKVKIRLQPICIELKKGEKLRISISGSSWPAIGINSGKRNQLSGPVTINTPVTTISLFLEDAYLGISHLLS